MPTPIGYDIDAQIRNLEERTDDELLDVVGAFALSQQPEYLRDSLAADNLLDVEKIREAGRRFLSTVEPVIREVICGPDGIAQLAEEATVRDVLNIVLPALGISVLGVVPTAIIAICVIVIRVGLRKYCGDR